MAEYSKAETLLCRLRSVWSRLWFFQWSCMDVRVGLWRKLRAKELMLLNCGVGEDSWESFGLQGDPTHLMEIIIVVSLEGMMLKLKLLYFGHLVWRVDSLEKLWCWEGLGAGGEGDDRGWDGWMASRTRWTCVWVNSGSWWWTGRPGMLWFMGSQRVEHDWATELNWTELTVILISVAFYKPFVCSMRTELTSILLMILISDISTQYLVHSRCVLWMFIDWMNEWKCTVYKKCSINQFLLVSNCGNNPEFLGGK